MASRSAPARHAYPHPVGPIVRPGMRHGRLSDVTLVLVPAGQRANAVTKPTADVWILVLAGSGTAGPRRRFLRPGTLLRLSSTLNAVNAAVDGLAYLSITTG